MSIHRGGIKKYLGQGIRQDWSEADKVLSDKIQSAHKQIHLALCNNFDTPSVMKCIRDIVTDVNKYITDHSGNQDQIKVLLLKKAGMLVTKFLRMFGVYSGNDDIGASAASAGGAVSTSTLHYITYTLHNIRHIGKTKWSLNCNVKIVRT